MEDIELYHPNYKFIEKVKKMTNDKKYSFEIQQDYKCIYEMNNLLDDIYYEYLYNGRIECEYIMLNICLCKPKVRFSICASIITDLNSAFYVLLSSIKVDHTIVFKNMELKHEEVVEICEYLHKLNELYKIKLKNCIIDDKDIKLMKESVKDLPNLKKFKVKKEISLFKEIKKKVNIMKYHY